MDRESLGRLVRETWVEWAREQPAPKASWLVPWDDLAEPDREVDHRIGERLYALGRREGIGEGVRAERDVRDVCSCGDCLAPPTHAPRCERCDAEDGMAGIDAPAYPAVEDVVAGVVAGEPAWALAGKGE